MTKYIFLASLLLLQACDEVESGLDYANCTLIGNVKDVKSGEPMPNLSTDSGIRWISPNGNVYDRPPENRPELEFSGPAIYRILISVPEDLTPINFREVGAYWCESDPKKEIQKTGCFSTDTGEVVRVMPNEWVSINKWHPETARKFRGY